MRDSADIAWCAVTEQHALQQHEELAILLDQVRALDPLMVTLEIGCDAGGTLWAWKQVCPVVLGITLPAAPRNDSMLPEGRFALNSHGATMYLGNSHDPSARLWLDRQLSGHPVDFLFIDGDHSTDGALADIAQYAPYVRPGGLIAVDDVLNPDLTVGNAWALVRQVTPHGAGIEVIDAGGLTIGIGLVHVPA